MADDTRGLIRFSLRLGVPVRREDGEDFIGLSLRVRVTTFHLIVGGAIAAGVLYLILGRDRHASAEVEPAVRPAQVTRLSS